MESMSHGFILKTKQNQFQARD